eukprot:1722998-Prymnesium_polylepis.1
MRGGRETAGLRTGPGETRREPVPPTRMSAPPDRYGDREAPTYGAQFIEESTFHLSSKHGPRHSMQSEKRGGEGLGARHEARVVFAVGVGTVVPGSPCGAACVPG